MKAKCRGGEGDIYVYIFALTGMSLTPGQVGDAGGVLRERRPGGKKQICSRDTSRRTSPTPANRLTTCCRGGHSPSVCLSLSLLPSFLTLISALHTNNHPDTCLSRRSFSRWNVLTFNLLCPAGNLSHARPKFLSFRVSAWCGWCIFLVTPVFFYFLFFPHDDRKHVGEALERFLTKVFPPLRWWKTQSTSRLETWTITRPHSTGNRTLFISPR